MSRPGRWLRPALRAAVVLGVGSALGAGCDKPAPSEPSPSAVPSYDPNWWASRDPTRRGKAGAAGAPEKRPIHARRTAPVAASADDPLHGQWSLGEATAGLPAGDQLRATIRTSLGELQCTLWPDRAPITVANFVGLARGLRPWKTPEGRWEKRPAYDGTTFFRVLGDFVVQGGSPNGERDGGAGYLIPDEVWDNANHDRAGLLCMATLGHDKGSMQFFVTDAPALSLDGSFTIFGECLPLELVHRIASVEVDRGRPKQAVLIETVRIDRGPASTPPVAAPAGSSRPGPTPAASGSPSAPP